MLRHAARVHRRPGRGPRPLTPPRVALAARRHALTAPRPRAGGRLEVSSPEGEGSTFSVLLPA